MFFAQIAYVFADAGMGAAFRRGLPTVLIATVVLIVVHLIYVMARRGEAASRPSLNLWEKLIYLGALGSVAVLGVTSFFAMLWSGVLAGWPLFFHMVGAGAFTAVLPLLAISWADQNRCECCGSEDDGDQAAKFSALPKVTFWLLLVSGFVVTSTMLVSMLPVYGSDGLHILLDIHRYSGLVAVVALVLHFYGMMLQRVGLR